MGVVSTLTAISSGVGYYYTDEMVEKYEMTDKMAPTTKLFTKMNFGVQGAGAVLLMKPELWLVALAGTFYSLGDQMGEAFDMPRYPLFAWSVLPFVFQWAMDAGHLPAWAFGAFMIANGVAGIVAWDTITTSTRPRRSSSRAASSPSAPTSFRRRWTTPLIRASATSPRSSPPPSSSSRWWTEWAASTRWAPTSGRRSTRGRRALRLRGERSIRPPLVSLLALPSGTGWTWS